ncbi:MAG: hypothetical protein OXT67_12625 [Zetaproteobacteria bacterium]|nr:hypothetical protein [Zetaproteobacteria bacterium]
MSLDPNINLRQYTRWLRQRGLVTLYPSPTQEASTEHQKPQEQLACHQPFPLPMGCSLHQAPEHRYLFIWDHIENMAKITQNERAMLSSILRYIDKTPQHEVSLLTFTTDSRFKALSTTQDFQRFCLQLLALKGLETVVCFGAVAYNHFGLSTQTYLQTLKEPNRVTIKQGKEIKILALPHLSEMSHMEAMKQKGWHSIQQILAP